jgi:hypothetical protein
MNRLLRCTAAVFVAVFLLGGLMSLRTSWLTALGLDLWTVEEALERLQVQRQRSEELAIRAREVFARCREKTTIAHDLVEGKMTLPQAIVRMRDVCNAEPNSWKWLRRAEPGRSDEERLHSHLLGWIRPALRDDPVRAEAAIARFQKEFRKGTGHGGVRS